MRQFKEIRIGWGLMRTGEDSAARMEAFQHLTAGVMQDFHPRSSCFWRMEDGNKAFPDLLKAACFETYRQQLDLVLLTIDPEALPASAVRWAVRQAEQEALVLEDRGAPSLVLLQANQLLPLAATLTPPQWADITLGGFPALLEQAGIGLVRRPVDNAPLAPLAPDAFCLPTSVHFTPRPQVGAASQQCAATNLTSQVCAVLQALAQVGPTNRVALYGAGTVAEALYPLLRDKVVLIVDSSPSRQGAEFHGLTIDSPEGLARRQADFDTLFITPISAAPAIVAQLRVVLGDQFAAKQVLPAQDRQTERKAGVGPNLVTPAPADGGLTQLRLCPETPPPTRPPTTTERTLTQRGVLYVGYPCNIRCVFCYYTYTPDKKWHSLEECKGDATLYRQEYGNQWVDITGGEPTIYPHILPLLSHCREIGLRASLITNTLALAKLDRLKQFQDHGVYDFLCSVHALTENYDMVTACPGAWKKMEQAITNFGRVGMKWRTNCTMTAHNMRQLKRIAEFSWENGSRAINFISYNPFYEWKQKMDIDFQAKHSEIAPYLLEALAYCDEVGLEANVRYVPLCLMQGHEEKAYNYSQLSYDHHEWDYCSWFSEKTRNPSSKTPKVLIEIAETEEKLHLYLARIITMISFDRNDICRHCANGPICDGLTNQYAHRFGIDELRPYPGSLVVDPTHYIKNQRKIVDL